jgi:hypothetical protein
LHCAGSFYAVRSAGLVALASWYKAYGSCQQRRCLSLGRPLTPMSVADVNRRIHRRAYRHYYYGNPYAYRANWVYPI